MGKYGLKKLCQCPLGHSPLGHSPLGHSPLGHSPLGHSPLGHSPKGAHFLETIFRESTCKHSL
jgi:hypothetical protein